MITVAFRIIPSEKGWLVEFVGKPVSRHTSRTKALYSSLRKVFADNPGRRAFNLILEVEDE